VRTGVGRPSLAVSRGQVASHFGDRHLERAVNLCNRIANSRYAIPRSNTGEWEPRRQNRRQVASGIGDQKSREREFHAFLFCEAEFPIKGKGRGQVGQQVACKKG
jgi:hypothetical protein